MEAKFSEDGAVSDDYWDASPRVLFLLKETNNYGRDLRQWLRAKAPAGQTWWNVARWSHGFLNGFPPYAQVPQIRSELRKVLRSVAAVNLKKSTGGGSADMHAVHEAAVRDRLLIEEQVALIAPEFVVSCGVRDPVVWLFDLQTKPLVEGVRWARRNGTTFLFGRHPSRADNEAVYEALRSAWRELQAPGAAP